MILTFGIQSLQCLRFLTTSGAKMGSARGGWSSYFLVASESLTRLAGYTVAVWWIALALSGRWAVERDSKGRLARDLGWCWIAMALASELGIVCFALNY